MVKEVRSSLKVTDKLIIEREGVTRSVTGRDLQYFIEDSQDRFTDDSEEAIAELTEEVDANTELIKENNVNNIIDHVKFEGQIRENKFTMVNNRTELNATVKRVEKLEHDNRTFGYYSFAWTGLAQSDEDLPPSPPSGTFILLNKENKITTDPKECAQVFFNKTDMMGRDRTFLGIYSGDSLELSFMYRTDEGYENEGRLSFRVVKSHDSGGQLGNDTIKVDVKLVNEYNPSYTYTVNDYDEEGVITQTTTYQGYRMVDTAKWPTPFDSYVKCGSYPSLLVDDNVDTSVLMDALLPIGAICIWPGLPASVPKGWLVCDGRDRTKAKSGLTTGQAKQVDRLFDTMGFTTLPRIAGRFAAGVVGNYVVKNKGVHGDFTDLGKTYKRKTGRPMSNNAVKSDPILVENGKHTHNTNITADPGHGHKYGSSANSTGGNVSNVHDARNHNGSYNTSEFGDHSHNLTVNEYTTTHHHDITNFNSDHRPHSVARPYIIKYN